MALAHYTDYQDSHFYKGSATDGGGIFVRDPVIDGQIVSGGGLNEAMELLDQVRKETAAIENVLGTDPAGTMADLAARLDRRMSPSGIPRAMCYAARTANPVAGTPTTVTNWMTRGSVYYQFGSTILLSGTGSTFVTYPRKYFASLGPEIVVAHMGTRSFLTGAVQVSLPSIGNVTSFRVYYRAWRSDGLFGVIDRDFQLNWVAIGGFPGA